MDERQLEATRDLLPRYLAGDEAAGRSLFERHRGALLHRARCHRLLGALKGELSAEDVVHETLARALSGGFLDRFEDRGPGSLLGALGRILDHVLVDECRRRGAAKRGANALAYSIDGDEGSRHTMHADLASPDPTPTSQARAHELVDLCRQLLAGREAEVWQLVEIEELSPADVARRLGSTPAAVRGVLFRARAKLLKALESRPRPDGT